MSEKKNDIGRYSSKNKMKIVLEHIKGETLDALSRKHKIPAHLISAWHEKFIEGGQSGLKTQAPDPPVSGKMSPRFENLGGEI